MELEQLPSLVLLLLLPAQLRPGVLALLQEHSVLRVRQGVHVQRLIHLVLQDFVQLEVKGSQRLIAATSVRTLEKRWVSEAAR